MTDIFTLPSLSPHSKKVLAVLSNSAKPLTAYDILAKLQIKTPPTVYRALETLVERGLVHRVESLGAFVACNHHEQKHKAATQFAVCRSCGEVAEIMDKRLTALIADIGKHMKFHIEREMLEMLGLCRKCDGNA